MTDRIKVNAMDNDETKWPSWTAQGATTYAEAGADFLIITPTTVDSNSCIEWCLLFIVRINYPKGLKKAPR